MANQLVPFEMSRALDQIYQLQAQIGWRCARNNIEAIQEALRADIANLKDAVIALDRAFESEKNNPRISGAPAHCYDNRDYEANGCV